MKLTTVTGAAAALMLRPGPPDGSLRRLTAVASSVGLGGSLSGDEVDGELLLCLADLLHSRALRVTGWAAEVTALVDTRPDAADALRELAEGFRRRSQWGAAAWCDGHRQDLVHGCGGAYATADSGGWDPPWLADWLAAEMEAGSGIDAGTDAGIDAGDDRPKTVAAAG